MKTFEYLVPNVVPARLNAYLDKKGAEGWELVTASLDREHPSGSTWRLILKREVPDA